MTTAASLKDVLARAATRCTAPATVDTMSDAELWALWQQGDTQARDELLTVRFKETLQRACRRIGASCQLPYGEEEELLAVVRGRLLVNPPASLWNYAGACSVGAWLYGAAVSLARNECERRGLHQARCVPLHQHPQATRDEATRDHFAAPLHEELVDIPAPGSAVVEAVLAGEVEAGARQLLTHFDKPAQRIIARSRLMTWPPDYAGIRAEMEAAGLPVPTDATLRKQYERVGTQLQRLAPTVPQLQGVCARAGRAVQ